MVFSKRLFIQWSLTFPMSFWESFESDFDLEKEPFVREVRGKRGEG